MGIIKKRVGCVILLYDFMTLKPVILSDFKISLDHQITAMNKGGGIYIFSDDIVGDHTLYVESRWYYNCKKEVQLMADEEVAYIRVWLLPRSSSLSSQFMKTGAIMTGHRSKPEEDAKDPNSLAIVQNKRIMMLLTEDYKVEKGVEGTIAIRTNKYDLQGCLIGIKKESQFVFCELGKRKDEDVYEVKSVFKYAKSGKTAVTKFTCKTKDATLYPCYPISDLDEDAYEICVDSVPSDGCSIMLQSATEKESISLTPGTVTDAGKAE